MATTKIDIHLLRVEQPSPSLREEKLTFFVGVLSAKQLLEISEVQRMYLKDKEVPKYEGIQRAIVPARVDLIRRYLETPHPILANSIILALHGPTANKILEKKTQTGFPQTLTETLTVGEDFMSIIDGQHRAEALDACPAGFEIPVAILIDPDIDLMAYVFNKINSTQKPVNSSIGYQLFGYSKFDVPQKLAHQVVMALAQANSSPFKNKFRILGTKDEWSRDPYAVTQSTFAREFLKLVSGNAVRDEYDIMAGKLVGDQPNRPFRAHLQVFDPKPPAIILQRWFNAIASEWATQWKDTRNFNLAKSTGISGWMRAIHKLLTGHGHGIKSREGTEIDAKDLSKEQIKLLIEAVSQSMDRAGKDFTSEDFASNETGINELRDEILRAWPLPSAEAE